MENVSPELRHLRSSINVVSESKRDNDLLKQYSGDLRSCGPRRAAIRMTKYLISQCRPQSVSKNLCFPNSDGASTV